MKVKQNRHGQTLRRAGRAQAACFVGFAATMTMALALAPTLAPAQSAGMAHLLQPRAQPSHASGTPTPGKPPGAEHADQREARGRAEKYRSERDMADRAGRQGHSGGNPKLSPDERKTLRKNLYELGREMYQGG
ncbi:hypothetical protein [Cupriavidus campinensis]